jgi:ATP-dependent helicase HrpA
MRAWDGEPLPERIEAPGGSVFPARVDEGASVGIRAFPCAAAAAESHRAGCVRLLLLALGDHAAWLAKRFPLGMAARIELPRLGTGGTAVADLVAVAGEAALGSPLPRDPADFAARLAAARSGWHDAATRLGGALDEAVAQLGPAREWIASHRRDRHLAAVAEDLEEELGWLWRGGYARRAGPARLAQYGRRMRAIRTRLARLDSLPLLKDLEKMERVRRLWVPWLRRWTAAPDDPRWWDFGWRLEDLRAALFAPELGTAGVSEKALDAEWRLLQTAEGP